MLSLREWPFEEFCLCVAWCMPEVKQKEEPVWPAQNVSRETDLSLYMFCNTARHEGFSAMIGNAEPQVVYTITTAWVAQAAWRSRDTIRALSR